MPAEWPEAGAIELKGLRAGYRAGLPDVLKGVTLRIAAGERVGVVGRTGSGKSSICLCLFRLMARQRGLVTIDGVDTATVELGRLRRSIGIIPQDPVLFLGSVRYNLDPFGRHGDAELWRALERAHVAASIRALDAGLSSPVQEGGSNFSQGERQLLCMARALLRNSRIMILDEATASIDTRTDELIQQTIRAEFVGCTVLTIAHRIDTIVDADRILVLDAGEVAEFDPPKKLLKRRGSSFKALARASGIALGMSSPQ